MSTPAIHHASLCEAVKVLGYAGLCGASYNPGAAHPDLPADEQGLLEFTAPDGLRFVFSGSGFTFPGHGFVPYQDVFRADWPYLLKDQNSNYQNYLMITFQDDRPAIKIYVGIKASSLSHLIILMRALTRGQPKKDWLAGG
jgi:hypothetical protein